MKELIDSVYPLRDIAEAFRHFGEGHARGRVVVTVQRDGGDESIAPAGILERSYSQGSSTFAR